MRIINRPACDQANKLLGFMLPRGGVCPRAHQSKKSKKQATPKNDALLVHTLSKYDPNLKKFVFWNMSEKRKTKIASQTRKYDLVRYD